MKKRDHIHKGEEAVRNNKKSKTNVLLSIYA